MPFDNPHQTPFGDLELLKDARSHISDKRDWVQGCYRDGDRYCLVAALSTAAKSPTFHTPNRVERATTGLFEQLDRLFIEPDPDPFSVLSEPRKPLRLSERRTIDRHRGLC